MPMLTPTEELLWNAVKEKKYVEVKALIEAHPDEDLVNSLHPSNSRSLLMHLTTITIGAGVAKPRNLLEYLLKHPKMNWNFQNPKTKETLISSILSGAAADADLAIIECLKDVPGFLIDGNQLTYEVAIKQQNSARNLYHANMKRGKPSDKLEQDKLDVETYDKIVSMVRDMTVLYAIKTDDDVLYERLRQVGADPSGILGPLGGNKLSGFLLTPANVKIKASREKHVDETLKEMSSYSPTFFAHMDEYQKLLAEKEAIKRDYMRKQIAVYEKSYEERKGILDEIMTLLKFK